jgi:hypothetical protein
MPFVGARSPEAIDIEVKSSTFDLSAVSSIEITVRSPARKVLDWAWSIETPTVGSIHLVHAFSNDGLDAPVEGKYTISGWLVTASTRRRIKPITIKFERY